MEYVYELWAYAPPFELPLKAYSNYEAAKTALDQIVDEIKKDSVMKDCGIEWTKDDNGFDSCLFLSYDCYGIVMCEVKVIRKEVLYEV